MFKFWPLKKNISDSDKRFQDALDNLDSKLNDIDILRDKIKSIKVEIDVKLGLIPSIPPIMPRGTDEQDARFEHLRVVPSLKSGRT